MTLPATVGESDPIRLFNTDLNRFEIGNGMMLSGCIMFLMSGSSQGCDGIL
jgi:hypothetical protein